GNPIPAGGLTFNGSSGNDTLYLQGTTGNGITSTTCTATGANSGTITLAGALRAPTRTITYTDVQDLDDRILNLLSPIFTTSLTFNASANADTITVLDAFHYGGAGTARIESSTSTFTRLTFANHDTLKVYGLGGNDTFNLDSLPGTGALTSVTLDGGANND